MFFIQFHEFLMNKRGNTLESTDKKMHLELE